MDVLFFLLLLGGAVVFGIHRLVMWSDEASRRQFANSAGQRARAAEIQTASERRALELIVEFPGMSDEQIATLMRDELLNMRSQEPRYFQWATPDTVGRMRRTLIVEAVRAERDAVDVRIEK